jgi:hypothetical protein
MKNEGNGQLFEKQVTYAAHFSMQNQVMIQVLFCNGLLPAFDEQFLF